MNATSDLKAEVPDLTWALLDEQATDREIRRLETLLLASGEARGIYAGCVQMHVDLLYLFGGRQARLPKLTNIPLPPSLTDSTTCPDSLVGSPAAN
jgi:hypothetical protein